MAEKTRYIRRKALEAKLKDQLAQSEKDKVVSCYFLPSSVSKYLESNFEFLMSKYWVFVKKTKKTINNTTYKTKLFLYC